MSYEVKTICRGDEGEAVCVGVFVVCFGNVLDLLTL